MEILVVLIVIVIIIAIQIFISNVKYRAKQHLLRNTGISSSELSETGEGIWEESFLKKFINDNPTFTEESIKNLLKEFAYKIIQKENDDAFSQEVYKKRENDKKADKMQEMNFVRVNIYNYSKPKLNAFAIYSDNKDEYKLYLKCNVENEKITVEKYNIAKGEVLGF